MQSPSQHAKITTDKERRSVPLIVIKRKLRRPKTVSEILADAQKYRDPSHASEKLRNPLEFTKTSYAKALMAKPLWDRVSLTAAHVQSILGEPTRILSVGLEWVVKIKSKEVIKVSASARGIVSIWGFNKTEAIEKWVERLLNS